MFGNNAKPEMLQINRKSSRKFAEARKLDERELAQSLVEIGFLPPPAKGEDVVPIHPIIPSVPDNKQ